MGQFDPNPSEKFLIANWFSESAMFLGNSVRIYVPVSNTENLQGDPIVVTGGYYQANGIFDVRPNRRTMNGYGWYNEDPDAHPILMYLPEYDVLGNSITILQDTQVEINEDIAGTGTKMFHVHKYLTTSIPGFYWIAWLTPARAIAQPYQSSDPGQNFNYIEFSG